MSGIVPACRRRSTGWSFKSLKTQMCKGDEPSCSRELALSLQDCLFSTTCISGHAQVFVNDCGFPLRRGYARENHEAERFPHALTVPAALLNPHDTDERVRGVDQVQAHRAPPRPPDSFQVYARQSLSHPLLRTRKEPGLSPANLAASWPNTPRDEFSRGNQRKLLYLWCV